MIEYGTDWGIIAIMGLFGLYGLVVIIYILIEARNDPRSQ